VNNIESSYYTRGDGNRLQEGAKWDVSWRQQRGYPGVAGLPPSPSTCSQCLTLDRVWHDSQAREPG
jgi:hypothetical protein